MNTFGLGIVLNVTDNMSMGLVSALRTFDDFENGINRVSSATATGMSQIETSMLAINNLATSGLGLQALGSQIANVGTSMLSPMVNLGQQVVETGSQFENYRATLKALYGDIDTATSKTQSAMELAAKTPFQLGDVMDSVIGFKAIGVEALDTMEHLTGESRTFLEYIGDLASLRPDIGLEGMLFGIRNLLGGDGGRSLRSRLDMDFEQMLGFEWADTTEGMIEQIVYASQTIANGLMKEMEGSWQHMTSNIEDQWDKLKLSISDAGAFDSVKGTLRYFYEIVDSIDEEKMARIGENLSSAFNMIWKPIDFVARKLSDVFNGLVNIIAESPFLTKLVTGFVAVAGVSTVLLGALTILGGSVMIAYAGFKGLQLLFLRLPIFIAGLTPKLLSISLVLGKFALIAGAIYTAWKTDFMGIRTIIQNFAKTLSTAFSESTRISNLGVNDMLSALKKLDTTEFGGWLTYRLTQLKVFWIGLVDAWNDYELSDENFNKLRELGLLPLLETILDIKLRAEAFFEGFKNGFKLISEVVTPILMELGEKLLDLVAYFFPIEDGTKNMNKEFDAIDLTKWEQLGELVGVFAFGLLLAVPLFTIAKIIYGIATGIVGFITTVGSVISTIWGWISAFIGFLATITGLSTGWVIAILVAGALLVAGIIKYKDEIWETLKSLIGFVGSIFVGGFQMAFDLVIGILETAVDSISGIIDGVFTIFDGIITFITGVFTGNWSKAWEGVKKVFKGVFDSLVSIVKTPLNIIIDCINAVIGGLNKIKINVPDWVPGLGGNSYGINIAKIPKLNTGGYIKDEGISMLHPNEVVINDELTRKLRSFLNGESDSVQRGLNLDDKNNNLDNFNTVTRQAVTNNQNSQQVSNDYSVTFDKGSIQINVENGNDTDVELIAQKIMQKIKRQQQLEKTRNYQPY